MNHKKLAFVFLCQLAGALLFGGQGWAAERDHHPFRGMQSDPRRQPMQQFRQERQQNAQQFKAQREEQRARVMQPPRPPDVNRNPGPNREEAARAMPPGAPRQFDGMDANRDGTVSREEMRALREKRRQQRWGNGDPRN